ncbi:uncharacterized protein M6B38_331170 [Iris pallida]|uniref:Uncharacterized protein n=1 Tax=Iris pallida TaxID=29817 RepID=A0AAX6H348_IRIPA|nr:uncharacterized protein M6B38_331170 [Iris pallida]
MPSLSFIYRYCTSHSLPPFPKPNQRGYHTMGEAAKVLRSSVHAFFHSYHSYTSVAALLVFPVSGLVLLSQAVIASSPQALHPISSRLHSLFLAAAFPVSRPLFSILNLMLSQTIFSSVFALPFTLTLLVLAKASVIQTASEYPRHRLLPPPFSSLLRLYSPLLLTHLFNSFLILSANAAVFSLLSLSFTAAEILGLSSSAPLLAVSSAGAVLYSVAIANTVVTCNLAVVVSAMEGCGGYPAVLRACLLIRGRVATALSLALPINLAMAAVEALFQYRVMRAYRASSGLDLSIVSEGFTIAYIHSVLVVLEIIASCLFYKSCRESSEGGADHYRMELEPEDKCAV